MGGFARDMDTQFALVEKVQIVIGITTPVVDDDKIPVIESGRTLLYVLAMNCHRYPILRTFVNWLFA